MSVVAALPGLLPAAVVAAQQGPADWKVSPGLAGFIATFFVALATVFLIRSMVGHLRKVRYSPDPAAPDGPDAGQDAASDAGRSPADPPDDRS